MNIQAQQSGFYALLLFLAAGLFVVALGPGMWGNVEAGVHSWQHLVFDMICHQDPERSFFLNGTPMAVCARCIGIYGAFFAGVAGMPVTARYIPVRNRRFMQLMVVVIVLNMLDIFGNLLGIWTNTLISRLLLGSLFGISVAFFLTNEFFNINLDTEIQHGE